MNSARSVRVAGPGSLAELVEPVRRILGLPEGEFDDSSWSAAAVAVRPASVEGYDYVVTIDGTHLVDPQARRLLDHDREARQIFYSLANTTPWALCLLDHAGAPRVQRPAVVPTTPPPTRPLDAGPQPMTSERSVRVTGPESLAQLVARVRDILGLPEGEFHDNEWSTGAVSVRPAPVADYDYVVLLDGSHLADPQARRLLDHDREARQIFYSLANTTPWALCLLDHVGAPRVQRPAVVPTNQA